MDEVYSHRSLEYINGKFYGAGGEITKTMVSMVPIMNISADILYSIWKNIVSQVTKIRFDIAVTMTDGHSPNMALSNQILVAAYSCYMILFYNNWMNKIYFKCPQLVGDASNEHISPCFSHLEEIY